MNCIIDSQKSKVVLLVFLLSFLLPFSSAQAGQQLENPEKTTQQSTSILGAKKINPTTVEISLSGNQIFSVHFKIMKEGLSANHKLFRQHKF